MNFTREPIIETIISSKEGHKLLLRNSKNPNAEEHTVDAVEVISFGSSLFFRSLERPKTFLLPVSDFEVIEVRESKITLKNAQIEKSVKIETNESAKKVKNVNKPSQDGEGETEDRKRDRNRRSRKRRDLEHAPVAIAQEIPKETESKPLENIVASSSVLTQLFPPPRGLISEKIARFRAEEAKAQALAAEESASCADIADRIEAEEKKLDHIWTLESDHEDDDAMILEEEGPSFAHQHLREEDADEELPSLKIEDPSKYLPD